jgi:hypothetical protein
VVSRRPGRLQAAICRCGTRDKIGQQIKTSATSFETQSLEVSHFELAYEPLIMSITASRGLFIAFGEIQLRAE